MTDPRTSPPPLTDDTNIGDIVVQCRGASVPKNLLKCFCKVVAIDGGRVTLSRPYTNKECTVPYFDPRTAKLKRKEWMRKQRHA